MNNTETTETQVVSDESYIEIIGDAQIAINNAHNFLTKNGVKICLSEWLTPLRYCEKYGKSQQVVNNWIVRGVIPAENVITVPELNGLRLIKAQEYR